MIGWASTLSEGGGADRRLACEYWHHGKLP